MLDKFYNLWAYNRFDTLPSLDRLMGRWANKANINTALSARWCAIKPITHHS